MPKSVPYTYPSPLAGFEDAPPLSEEKNADGKSLANPKREGLSDAYERFTQPLDTGIRGGLYVFFSPFCSLKLKAFLPPQRLTCVAATFTYTTFRTTRSKLSTRGNSGNASGGNVS